MRALTLALLVAFVVASQAYTESNELNKSPREIVAESDLMSDQYDVVVFIGDSYENLPASLSSIADAISAYVKINPGAGSAMSVIPYSVHPSRKLIWASTGDLSSDIASSRKLRQTGENAMRRVHNLGFQRVLLVIGPLMTAHHSFDWAFGDYPKMSAALGGLHYLFKPLQVREMVGPEAKVDKLGLYDFSPKLLKFVEAVGEGMGVLRDIGDSDPERTAPPKIVEYIEARRPDWEAAGISLTVEDVIQMKDKYPMAYAVNRATIPNPNHHGKVVTAVYTPKSNTPITETIILVGKGVALDTGGADLKTEGGMYGMHNDKLGAAFVAGFFHTLSLLKPEGVKVIGYMPYIRNSIGKYAYLPDEIITLVNGLRVRIGDTDAEGRNIMSDVLYYAKEQVRWPTCAEGAYSIP
uniref:CYTOSOL_AP domain-containing protein n=1 Tax=Mesocestoides corti TaxID=53468 RepID=A0A5K3EPU9_MESCO